MAQAVLAAGWDVSHSDQIREWMSEAGCQGIKPSGDNLIATCPFNADDPFVHASKKNMVGPYRSFSMNADTGQFICFSESCGEHGGLVKFLVNALGMTFERATQQAQEFGVFEEFSGSTPEWDTEFPSWEDRRRRREPEEESPFPDYQLGLYDFCPRYLLRRGFRKDVLRQWEIGWDVERRQVVIPVRDGKGKLIGVSRRKSDDEAFGAKYLHMEFKRNRHVYGAHLAKGARAVWVGEGQLDAVALGQLGLPSQHRPVSTMGSRVGPTQIKLLSRYPLVVLAFDGDVSGLKATLKTGDGLAQYGTQTLVTNLWGLRKRYKDPADLLKAPTRVVERFIEDLEPYDSFMLRWLKRVDLRWIRQIKRQESPRQRRAG